MAEYSRVPLSKKLGIRTNSELVVVNEPRDYRQLIAPVPDGVRLKRRVTKTTDMVHMFTTSKRILAKLLQSCIGRMAFDAALWVSWPKKSSKIKSDVTEDSIRGIALPLGLVDIKVCAVDDQWSGLKLVIRKENRKAGRA